MSKEEKWEYISRLSEIRSKYSCFEDDEEPYYKALSEGIKALKALEQEPNTRWIPATTPPKENGRYLVTRKCFTTFIDIVSYSTNLYKVNKYEFYDKKNKAGWWDSDSEYGSFEVSDVIGWQELPEKMESEVEE